MAKVYSKALQKSIQVERIIGHIQGNEPGPTILFIGGMHGNEPSGVFALKEMLGKLSSMNGKIKGNIYGICGNLSALEHGERYHKFDLNRLWTDHHLNNLLENGHREDDYTEFKDLYDLTAEILANNSGPFYFIDLHTTSGETSPFLTLNDTIMNRRFSMGFPVPIILGIEEFIHGPYLSYINELGYVALGFESGQHDAKSSIENHESFIALVLNRTGAMNIEDITNYASHYKRLNNRSIENKTFFEIQDLFHVPEGKKFQMNAGYVNFQNIEKGEHLATFDGTNVHSIHGGKIFMPLYQKKGTEGYFIIRRIPKIALKLSAWLRKIHFDKVLTLLPGVSWESSSKHALRVNKNIARFFTREFFHLLGYRNKQLKGNFLHVQNRERNFKIEDYLNEPWRK